MNRISELLAFWELQAGHSQGRREEAEGSISNLSGCKNAGDSLV